MSEPTLEEGRVAVGIARETLRDSLEGPYGARLLESVRKRTLPPLFGEKHGLFVTLLAYPGKGLRGCIGFTEPVYPLGEGIARAAWLAAREDTRFLPVEPGEVSALLIEVSVLGPLERIRAKTPEDLVKEVKVGRDGLVVSEEGASGLLLPQVPVDEGWMVPEFLSGVCRKAGLSPKAWTRAGPSFWRFGSSVFSEVRPSGDVVRRVMRTPLGPSPGPQGT